MQTGFGIVNPSGVGIYKLVIENEIAHFTAGTVTAGNQTWTLARGQEGTTAVSHASGVVVALEETKGTVDNMVQLTPTAQQTGTVNVSGAITSGGLLTGTGLTAPHASSHDVGGSDVLKDLTRLAAGPAMHGYTAWTYDPIACTTSFSPTAGVVYLAKILTAHAFTINSIDFALKTAGTGGTALANCFLGIYDSGGTRRFASADQSSAWGSGSGSIKSVAVSGGYLVTANDFVYIAMLIGTQSTTAFQPHSTSTFGTLFIANVTAAAYRFATQLTGQTSLTTPLTLSSNAAAASGSDIWFGVK